MKQEDFSNKQLQSNLQNSANLGNTTPDSNEDALTNGKSEDSTNTDLRVIHKQLHQIQLEKIRRAYELFRKWR